MDKYMCIKSFSVDAYDDEGFSVENESFEVEKGTVWGVSNDNYRFVGGKESTRLENEEGRWLEVYDDRIAHYFKRV